MDTFSCVAEVDRKLKRTVDIELSVNDLRIMTNCFNALEYMADEYGEDCMFTNEARELRDRLSGLYHDEIGGEGTFGMSIKSGIGA
jgi:hypothetical protein